MISVFVTFWIQADVLLRFLIFLIPIIVISKYFYSEQIQWRATVIFLGTLMVIVPEAILDAFLFYGFNLEPVLVLQENHWVRWILFILIALSYFFMDWFLEKLYRVDVREENKAMFTFVLSVLVFAYIPLAYILGKVKIIYFILFFILSFPLDYLLIKYIVKYAEYKEVKNVQAVIESAETDLKKSENVELYELRHDIGNYINALKIMEERKKKEEEVG